MSNRISKFFEPESEPLDIDQYLPEDKMQKRVAMVRYLKRIHLFYGGYKYQKWGYLFDDRILLNLDCEMITMALRSGVWGQLATLAITVELHEGRISPHVFTAQLNEMGTDWLMELSERMEMEDRTRKPESEGGE